MTEQRVAHPLAEHDPPAHDHPADRAVGGDPQQQTDLGHPPQLVDAHRHGVDVDERHVRADQLERLRREPADVGLSGEVTHGRAIFSDDVRGATSMGTVAGEGTADDRVGTPRVPEGVGRWDSGGETVVQPRHHVDRAERVGDRDGRRDHGPRSHRRAATPSSPRISRPVGVAWTPAWHAERTTTFGGGSMRSRS